MLERSAGHRRIGIGHLLLLFESSTCCTLLLSPFDATMSRDAWFFCAPLTRVLDYRSKLLVVISSRLVQGLLSYLARGVWGSYYPWGFSFPLWFQEALKAQGREQKADQRTDRSAKHNSLSCASHFEASRSLWRMVDESICEKKGPQMGTWAFETTSLRALSDGQFKCTCR